MDTPTSAEPIKPRPSRQGRAQAGLAEAVQAGAQAVQAADEPISPRTSQQSAEGISEINEQVLDFGRKAGLGAVEAYEATWTTVADYQDKVADSTKVDWIADAARAQANFTREVTRLYTSTARDLLKK